MHRTTASLGLVTAAAACVIAGCHDSDALQAYPEQLGGIGVALKASPDGHTVTGVVADGPAAVAGVQVGDLIVAIDGKPTKGKSLANVVDALRGKAGSSVVLRTTGARGDATVTLTRKLLSRTEGKEYRLN